MSSNNFLIILKNIFNPKEFYNNYLWLLHFRDKLLFDYRYGINTSTILAKTDLNFNDHFAQKHASRYRPASVSMIRNSLSTIINYDTDILNSQLVDYGCGSGRVLIVAEQLGFQTILGIELSPDLVELCKKNLNTFPEFRDDSEVTILKENARFFIPPKESRVFFFYRPFRNNIFSEVIANIYRSIDEHKRSVFLILVLCDYTINEDWVSVAKYPEYSIWRIDP